ncbi:MAG TPA: PAS domain S-box protein, partial [Roseiflexaceae bacterium]|nr:PAS domain S-box protein [Roseiflexaceae bacterium]
MNSGEPFAGEADATGYRAIAIYSALLLILIGIGFSWYTAGRALRDTLPLAVSLLCLWLLVSVCLVSLVHSRRQAAEIKRLRQDLDAARSAALVDLTADYSYTLEIRGHGAIELQSASDAFAHITGYTLDELQQHGGWFSIIHPDDRAALQDHIMQVAAGQPGLHEYRIVTRKSEICWLRDYAHPGSALLSTHGVLIRGVVQDISEQRRSEARINQSEQEFRALVDHAPDSIARLDRSFRYTYVNPTFVAAIGIPSEVIIGRTPFELGFVRLVHSPWMQAIGNVFSSATEQHLEFEFDTPTGRRTYDARLAPEIANDGQVVAVLEITRDITDRKHAEAQRALLDAAMQTIDDAIMITEANLNPPGPRIVYVNAGFTRLTGYTADEVIGQTPRILQSPATERDVLDRLLTDLQTTGRFMGETVNLRKDGSEFLLEWQIAPLRDDQGQVSYWVAHQRDVTERRRVARMQQERQKLESLGVLAGGIAHDFNNLLGVILGNAQLALLDIPPDSPVHSMVVPIIEAARRAGDLTRQMLAYSGGGNFVIRTVDLAAAIRAYAPALQQIVGEQTEIVLQIHEQLPSVDVDITQIHQLLHNLVRNAAEAIGDTSGTITITAEARQIDHAFLATTFLSPDLAEGIYVAVGVSDTGGGIDPAIVARVFEPFFTTRFVGRGLGLPATLGIMRGHRGAIKIDNRPGDGVTITAFFPAIREELPADHHRDDLHTAAKLQPLALSILVIDDEQPFLL